MRLPPVAPAEIAALAWWPDGVRRPLGAAQANGRQNTRSRD
jgi:hypothetical protein